MDVRPSVRTVVVNHINPTTDEEHVSTISTSQLEPQAAHDPVTPHHTEGNNNIRPLAPALASTKSKGNTVTHVEIQALLSSPIDHISSQDEDNDDGYRSEPS